MKYDFNFEYELEDSFAIRNIDGQVPRNGSDDGTRTRVRDSSMAAVHRHGPQIRSVAASDTPIIARSTQKGRWIRRGKNIVVLDNNFRFDEALNEEERVSSAPARSPVILREPTTDRRTVMLDKCVEPYNE